ncbi:coiled-coil domain-containing protein 32-like [Lineus longissimus]|uniref:coiled-coil domain-containing protein 32-like n=1 Tax=Lineus longissimus TaxID=88925 RepID=UPI002B4DF62E
MASNSEAEDVFAEDFPFSLSNPVNSDPWSPLPSEENGEKKTDFLELTSERYIASLEARLNRIQGKARDPTSKDLIRGLEKAKDAHMTTLVQSSDQPYISNYIPEKDNVQNPNKLQRKLHPEKVAISADERRLLVEEDDLSKRRKADEAAVETSKKKTSSVSSLGESDNHTEERPRRASAQESVDRGSCDA